MPRLLVALGTVSLLSACAPQPLAAPAPPAVDPASPLAAPMYLQTAASSDQFEIQSGQLASQMSQNPYVRAFGNMLVAHHTHTTTQLTAAAQAAGVPTPPPAMMPNHQAMLEQLRASGVNFDVAFRQVQIAAHQEALALHQNYANGGDVPALRNVAAAAVPVIQQHLAAAQALNVAPVTLPPPPSVAPIGERG